MRRALLGLLILAFLAGPAVAWAEGTPISLAEYQVRLGEVARQLVVLRGTSSDTVAEAARASALNRLGTTWTIETKQGNLTVDNRELAALIRKAGSGSTEERLRLIAAMERVDDLERTADAARSVAGGQPLDMTDARRRLDLALSLGGVQQRWYERVGAWLSHFWRAISPAKDAEGAGGPWLTWTALAIGLAGLLLLSRSLIRTLSGNAGSDEVGAGQGRRVPERALTPEELREKARRLSVGGEHREGLRLLHRALFAHLDELGLLRYVPAQTNREHERALRRRYPQLAGTLHLLNDLMDMRLYSDAPTDHAEFNQAEAWVEALWREGDAVSKSAEAMAGPLSSAPSP